jgi:hypothetical protein
MPRSTAMTSPQPFDRVLKKVRVNELIRQLLVVTRSKRCAVCVIVLAALVMGGACSSSSHTHGSLTPRVTDDPASPLESKLVSVTALDAIPGTPLFTTVPVAKGHIFEDPDPRGPCGAKLTQPKLDQAIAEFQTPTGQAIESLGDIGIAAATHFLHAYSADRRQGCAPYDSRTNEPGVTQHVVYEGPIRLPHLLDDAVADRLRITAQGKTVEFIAITLRRGGIIGTFVIMDSQTLPSAAVVAIAKNLVAPLR